MVKSRAQYLQELRGVDAKIPYAKTKKEQGRLMDKHLAIVKRMNKSHPRK